MAERVNLPMSRRMLCVRPPVVERIEKLAIAPLEWRQWARINLEAVLELAEESGQAYPIRRPKAEEPPAEEPEVVHATIDVVADQPDEPPKDKKPRKPRKAKETQSGPAVDPTIPPAIDDTGDTDAKPEPEPALDW